MGRGVIIDLVGDSSGTWAVGLIVLLPGTLGTELGRKLSSEDSPDRTPAVSGSVILVSSEELEIGAGKPTGVRTWALKKVAGA